METETETETKGELKRKSTICCKRGARRETGFESGSQSGMSWSEEADTDAAAKKHDQQERGEDRKNSTAKKLGASSHLCLLVFGKVVIGRKVKEFAEFVAELSAITPIVFGLFFEGSRESRHHIVFARELQQTPLCCRHHTHTPQMCQSYKTHRQREREE